MKLTIRKQENTDVLGRVSIQPTNIVDLEIYYIICVDLEILLI